ncbi:MAG: archease [Candidatus Bathyarchaeota archaeon]|nr:archease [Candidatus Bathyarchaeota archaeon]
MDERIKFEFLEHTADVYIASYGKTIEEAFENAAIAMFEVMTETKKIEPNIEDSIQVKGEDEHGLLYNWLEALLVNFETKNRIYSKFNIFSFKKNMRSFSLKAKVWGETFDPKKHLQKVGVKAVTYHRMEIIKDQNGVTLEFILDI